MLVKRFAWLLIVLSLSVVATPAQGQPEVRPLVAGQLIEREIAGGESHVYQISLAAGQFLNILLDQRAVDAAMILAGPDGKQLVEINLTGPPNEESLSMEAATPGNYQLSVTGGAKIPLRGSYRLKVTVKEFAGVDDRKRLTAEALMIEAYGLKNQGAKTALQRIEKADQAFRLWQELGERSLAVASLNSVADAYEDLGQYQKAIGQYEQALAINREAKNRTGEAAALYSLGADYGRLGQYDKTIEVQEQSAAIYRAVENRAGLGRAMGGVGVAYIFLGQYEKAIGYLEQALPMYRESKDRRGEGLLVNNLGAAYHYLGRYEKAIEYLEQALAISREVKSKTRETAALQSLGVLNIALGRPKKAIEFFELALPIIRDVKDRRLESYVLGGLADAYSAGGQLEKAIEYYELGLAAVREIKARGLEIEPLIGLGDVYKKLGKIEEAAQTYQTALRLARELKTQDHEATTLGRLMLVWKPRNRNLAVYFGKQSVNTYQEMRGNLRELDADTQRSFLRSKEQTYRELADLLISQGRLPEAEQVIRMLKDDEYYEYIRRDSANAPEGAKANLTPEETELEKRYREIADQLAVIGAERSSLMDKKSRTRDEEQRLAKLDADLVVAGNAFQKFLDQLSSELGGSRDSSSKVFQLRESQGLMEDLRELGKGTVALYTLVSEDKYRVILTTPDFQKGYEYPIKGSDLNRKVLEFRAVLQNPKYDPLPLAQELYKILVGPVAKDLKAAKAETLMWSLDGVLRYLPMAALNDGKTYLVEQYQNVGFTPASQARLKDVPARNWNALGLGVSKAHGERIPALPGVIDEMRGIIRDEKAVIAAGGVKQPGVLPGVVELDEQFTQQAMLTQLRLRPKVVHIASHFQFSPGNETNSALLLGDGTFLSLAQIKSLPNVFGGVELLTLSACNTATGSSGADGKEVEGFAVLAQRQGAKAVVASLWPVADRSTKELMQDFYRLREATSNISKAEALRQAQLRLLQGAASAESTTTVAALDRQLTHEEDKAGAAKLPFKPDAKTPYAHPYYWAPFILIGNWR